jgi:hypothetical protein
MLLDLGFKPLVLGLGLLFGQGLDGKFAKIADCHVLYLGHRRPPANRVGMPMYFPLRPG